jgi:hypothetical protein
MWKDLAANKTCSMLKKIILLSILFIVSVVLITPLVFSDVLIDWYFKVNVLENFIAASTMNTYIETLSIAIVNTMLIPFFIDLMVGIEDFPKKISQAN